MLENKTIKNTNINYILDRNKRRNSYIQIKDGNVVVKVPKNATEQYINEILGERIEWIKSKIKEYSNSNKNMLYEDNSFVSILGKKLTLKVQFSELLKRTKIENINNLLIINLPIEYKQLSMLDRKNKIRHIIDNYYKSIAKEEVFPAMEFITSRVGLYPQKIYIKNLKSTWGICSSKKYISINQNLMMYSRHAIEYVCLHEVCHLKYMNHSKEFWNMVAYYMPDYKLAKKELKS